MTSIQRIKLLAFAFALAGVGFAAPNADAGTRGKTTCSSGGGHHTVDYSHHRHSDRGWRSTRSHSRHHNDGFNFSIRIGSSDRHATRSCDSRSYNTRHVTYRSDRSSRSHHDDYHYSRTRTFTRSSCDARPTRTVVVTNNHYQRGYWKRVYVPAVYETRYYACGTPYRVCIRQAYYKRVWVSGSGHH